MKRVVLAVAFILSSQAFADEQKEKVCFNKNDEASSGMTSEEYYKAISSTCDQEVARANAKKKQKLASKQASE